MWVVHYNSQLSKAVMSYALWAGRTHSKLWFALCQETVVIKNTQRPQRPPVMLQFGIEEDGNIAQVKPTSRNLNTWSKFLQIIFSRVFSRGKKFSRIERKSAFTLTCIQWARLSSFKTPDEQLYACTWRQKDQDIAVHLEVALTTIGISALLGFVHGKRKTISLERKT